MSTTIKEFIEQEAERIANERFEEYKKHFFEEENLSNLKNKIKENLSILLDEKIDDYLKSINIK